MLGTRLRDVKLGSCRCSSGPSQAIRKASEADARYILEPRGMSLERFAIRQRLGAGGFGTVYEAFDHERNSVVALKAMQRQDPHALYRFKQEFRALSELEHPNLV